MILANLNLNGRKKYHDPATSNLLKSARRTTNMSLSIPNSSIIGHHNYKDFYGTPFAISKSPQSVSGFYKKMTSTSLIDALAIVKANTGDKPGSNTISVERVKLWPTKTSAVSKIYEFSH